MSMSSCPKCWNILCTCGHEYRDWDVEELSKHIAMLQRLLEFKKAIVPHSSDKEPKQ